MGIFAPALTKGAGGEASIYSGVPLKELLEHVGAVFTAARQQANLRSIVVVASVDGPSVLFAMAEFDSTLTDKSSKEEGDPRRQIGALRSKTDALGRHSRCCFSIQLATFGAGAALLVITVCIAYRDRLF